MIMNKSCLYDHSIKVNKLISKKIEISNEKKKSYLY